MTMWPVAVLALVLLVTGIRVCLRWRARWGATPEECARVMPGDAWFDDGARASP